VPDDKLDALLIDPAGEKTGMRLRTLAMRLGIQEKDFYIIKAKAGTFLNQLIIEAASGTVPADKSDEKKDYQSHGQTWFKSVEGGCELAEKVFTLGIWPLLQPQLIPFLNAVRKAVNLSAIKSLNP